MDKKIIMLVTRDGLGSVDDGHWKFGVEMFDLFLHTLEGQERKPQAICFYTSGVKLVCRGSPVAAGLQLIEGMGIQLVACKTCLGFYKLLDQVIVGRVGGMNEIQKLLLDADQVITV